MTNATFGIAIPQIWARPDEGPVSLQPFLARAEALGYDSAWVQEQVLGTANSLEPVALLSYAAATTRRIRLGTSVIVTTLRNPVQLAKSLATVDHLSDGRLIVGVGLGGLMDKYPAVGISSEARVRRFTDGIRTMKRLWTEDRVTLDAGFWKLENASMEPKPVQKPHPPIWFGARTPAAIRRAVEVGDGWIGAGASSAADFKEQVRVVRSCLAEAQREPTAFAVGKRVYLAVDRNGARALDRLRAWFGSYYGNAAMADRVCLWGGVSEVVDGLGELEAAGAGLLLLNPLFDATHHLELLAAEVIPQLTSATPHASRAWRVS